MSNANASRETISSVTLPFTPQTRLPHGDRSEPDWLASVLCATLPNEGRTISIGGSRFVRRRGILREESLASLAQGQTRDSFEFKWQQRDSFESRASLARMRAWLIERYGEVAGAPWWGDYGDAPLVLDAGCGAGMSALELFGSRLANTRYLGIDISGAVDVAALRFAERGVRAAFMQADITSVPLPENSVDVIFSEGVLHHTDSTERAFASLARILRPGGRFLFYVYKKKGPIREFTDDHIRSRLQGIDPAEAWKKMQPLTELGRLLGELEVEIEIPHEIELLDIPAGKISLQRLFYWHVLKAFYHPELSLDEMNHINFDWYAPSNARRHRPEEVESWCRENSFEIEREVIQDAGITIIARKRGVQAVGKTGRSRWSAKRLA